jgi:hypothetical protein
MDFNSYGYPQYDPNTQGYQESYPQNYQQYQQQQTLMQQQAMMQQQYMMQQQQEYARQQNLAYKQMQAYNRGKQFFPKSEKDKEQYIISSLGLKVSSIVRFRAFPQFTPTRVTKQGNTYEGIKHACIADPNVLTLLPIQTAQVVTGMQNGMYSVEGIQYCYCCNCGKFMHTQFVSGGV